MAMSTKEQTFIDIILSVLAGVTGVASTVDNIEQIGRIVLIFISICSALMLCVINYEKFSNKIKNYFK